VSTEATIGIAGRTQVIAGEGYLEAASIAVPLAWLFRKPAAWRVLPRISV